MKIFAQWVTDLMLTHLKGESNIKTNEILHSADTIRRPLAAFDAITEP